MLSGKRESVRKWLERWSSEVNKDDESLTTCGTKMVLTNIVVVTEEVRGGESLDSCRQATRDPRGDSTGNH